MVNQELLTLIKPNKDQAFMWGLIYLLAQQEIIAASHKPLVSETLAKRLQVPAYKVIGIDPEWVGKRRVAELESENPVEVALSKIDRVREFFDPRLKRKEALQALELTYSMVGPVRFVEILTQAAEQLYHHPDGLTAVHTLIREKQLYSADVCTSVNGVPAHRLQRDSHSEPTPSEAKSMKRAVKDRYEDTNELTWKVAVAIALQGTTVTTDLEVHATLPPYEEMKEIHQEKRATGLVDRGFYSTYAMLKGPGLDLTRLVSDMNVPFEVTDGGVIRTISPQEATSLIVEKVPPIAVFNELQRELLKTDNSGVRHVPVTHLLGQTRAAMVG